MKKQLFSLLIMPLMAVTTILYGFQALAADVETKVYVKATSAEQLVEGTKIVFVTLGPDAPYPPFWEIGDEFESYVMGPIENNYGTCVEVIHRITGYDVSEVEAPISCELVLGGTSGAYTLRTLGGAYLSGGTVNNKTALTTEGFMTWDISWYPEPNPAPNHWVDPICYGFRAIGLSENREIAKHNGLMRFGYYFLEDTNHGLAFIYVEKTNNSSLGDVDSDDKVSINDVATLINYLLNGNLAGVNIDNADVDGSGRISIDDVTTLINYLLSGKW